MQKIQYFSKLSDVREILVGKYNKPVNNAEIMEELLQSFLEQHRENAGAHELGGGEMNTFLPCTKETTNEQIFMTAKSSFWAPNGKLLKIMRVYAKAS